MAITQMIWVYERNDILCQSCGRITKNYQGDTDTGCEFECEYCGVITTIEDEEVLYE